MLSLQMLIADAADLKLVLMLTPLWRALLLPTETAADAAQHFAEADVDAECCR